MDTCAYCGGKVPRIPIRTRVYLWWVLRGHRAKVKKYCSRECLQKATGAKIDEGFTISYEGAKNG